MQKYIVTVTFAVFARSEQHAKDKVTSHMDVLALGSPNRSSGMFGEEYLPEVQIYDDDTRIVEVKEMPVDEKVDEKKLAPE